MEARPAHGWIIWIYAFFTALFLAIALILHHMGFPPAAPAGQAFVVAFTEDKAAKVVLTAQVNPNKPWTDTVTVDAERTSTALGSDRWLLVIQCPGRKSAVNASQLYTEAVQSQPTSAVPVTAYSGVGRATYPLSCFKYSSTDGSIANVVLPGLETDQSISTIQTAPTAVYLAKPQDLSAGVLQVFPGCPLPTAPLTTSPATPLPGASASAPASGAIIGGPAAALSPGCNSQTRWRTLSAAYYLPESMQTREVLKYVNLAGYQTESMFPVPEIRQQNGGTGQIAEEQYTWTGLSSLSPTLLVSNVNAAQADSKYTFNAGIFFGLCGATGVVMFDRFWIWLTYRRDQPAQDRKPKPPAAEGSSGPSAATIATGLPDGIADGQQPVSAG